MTSSLVEVGVALIAEIVIVSLHLRNGLCRALNDYVDRTFPGNLRHLTIEALLKIPTS